MRPGILLAVAVVALVLLPFGADRGMLFLASEILVVVALSQAWNLLAGYGGLLSPGHHGFVGIGGYALYVLTRDLPVHPYMAIPLAGIVTAVLGFLLAPILFRLREVYFAVGMWVAAEIFRIVVMRWDYTGGAAGLPLAAARSLNREWMGASAYWLALAVALGATALVWALMRSNFGLRLRALKDDELAARSIGVAPHRVRLAVFVLSVALTGMAGAVSFLSALFITPVAAFDINWMVTIVFVTIIGGIGRISGPFLGAALYFVLRETLAFSSSWYLVALGATAVLVMLVMPGGLAGALDRLLSRKSTMETQP
ncbi:branched-chain amino acid transport system permease protein [Lutimaribacter pacificus]|uniref:Amino acid/amide ABC transporter membrane protein 2, HAAT family n=1 Tax=Lutimaribacter pacificus TaxID=391948 RepID=A0A1H0IUK6_9RHOB|nr:branched-chain amino acid ABC transporter permease [Lutimaribacter pacificus]SDO35023.1 branched-chain amino acid transport system permease protein [Lutimaribacter pacificus]SHK17463.1 amino acid/amide ABC transporter membrane protein 2, HAAT family [Lutimaribacter pacificus]